MKLWIITLGFCNARTLKAGLTRLDETSTYKGEVERIFLDQYYPVNRKENFWELQSICKAHGFKFYDSGYDRGLHNGFNYVASLLPLGDEDLILLYDPDSWVDNAGFDSAMVEVLNEDKELEYISSWHWPIEQTHGKRVPGAFRTTSSGLKYFVPDIQSQWEMVSLGMYRWSFIKEIGGMKQPRAYYGFLEEHFVKSLNLRRKRMGFLKGFDNENPHKSSLIDPEYEQYKLAHSNQSFPGSFQEFLTFIGKA